MDHASYLKLKNKVKNKNFFNSYKGLKNIASKVSYFGNLFSILFAYFFMYEIITKAILNPTDNTPILVSIISVIILIMFESIKRFVFDKFSMSFIKNKYKFTSSEVGALTLIAGLLITGSFYLSLNGAKNYSSRDKEILDMTKTEITEYKDSLTQYYNGLIALNDSTMNNKIVLLENQSSTLFEDNRKYDKFIEDYTNNYNSLGNDTWQERTDKIRIQKEIKGYREEKQKNIDVIDKNDLKIADYNLQKDNKNLEYENELQSKLDEYKKEKNKNSSDKIEDNKGNSTKFLIFSTLIEIIILFGIYFPHHYEYRSVSEYEEKIKTDPNYKKFHTWNILLDMFLSEDDRIGSSIPYKKDMVKLLNANKISISNKDLDDALKIFVHLGILKTKGNKKLINCNLETGRDVVMKYLKID